MKAFMLKGLNNGEVVDVPKPEINDDEVLVKVDSCAICGTDIRTYRYGHAKVQYPRITGHEFSGTIAEVGKNVKGYKEGSRVMVVPGISCNECDFCQHGFQNLCENRVIIGFNFDGGFAEYVKIPAIAVKKGNIKVLPDKLSTKEACLVEPFAAVYNGQSLLDISIGTTVAIIGGGPIGIMHAIQARYRGASTIALFNRSEGRCKIARGFDIDYVVNSGENDMIEKSKEITKGKGFDVVIVSCVSGEAQAQALEMAKRGGKVSYFAGLPRGKSTVPIDTNLIHYKQLGVFGANGSGPNQYEAVIGFLGSGVVDLSKIITAELPLERILEGFENSKSGSGLKTIIHP